MKYKKGDRVYVNGEYCKIDGIYEDKYVIGDKLLSEEEVEKEKYYKENKETLKRIIQNGDLKFYVSRSTEHGKTLWEDGIGTATVYEYLVFEVKMDGETIYKNRTRIND